MIILYEKKNIAFLFRQHRRKCVPSQRECVKTKKYGSKNNNLEPKNDLKITFSHSLKGWERE